MERGTQSNYGAKTHIEIITYEIRKSSSEEGRVSAGDPAGVEEVVVAAPASAPPTPGFVFAPPPKEFAPPAEIADLMSLDSDRSSEGTSHHPPAYCPVALCAMHVSAAHHTSFHLFAEIICSR